jgi:hypothetical protein
MMVFFWTTFTLSYESQVTGFGLQSKNTVQYANLETRDLRLGAILPVSAASPLGAICSGKKRFRP